MPGAPKKATYGYALQKTLDPSARAAILNQQQQDQEMEKLAAANEYASIEAEKERQFASSEKEASFQRLKPFLEQLSGTTTTASASGELDSAQAALEASIEERGSKAQGKLSSLLAKRGVFASGAGVASAALLGAETEAGIAESRAKYAESDLLRRQREEESRRTALVQAMSFI